MEKQDRPTVLIVDDEPAIRTALARLLRLEGYRAEWAADGVEALRWLRSHPPPHAILLDLMMPVMSGWEFSEEQQKDPALAPIPVIVITAYAQMTSGSPRIPSLEMLDKPVDAKALIGLLRKIGA